MKITGAGRAIGIVLVLAGCGRSTPPATTPTSAADEGSQEVDPRVPLIDQLGLDVETRAKVEAALATEFTALSPQQPFALMEGRVRGAIPALVSPEFTCKPQPTGSTLCSTVVSYAQQGEDRVEMECYITDGMMVGLGHYTQQLADSDAGESSMVLRADDLGVAAVGEGLGAELVVDVVQGESPEASTLGTNKVAIFYGRGHSAMCLDSSLGQRQAFRTATQRFFADLRFGALAEPLVYEGGHVIREQGKAAGFWFTSVRRRGDGHVAATTYFSRDTSMVLAIGDNSSVTFFDENGRATSIRDQVPPTTVVELEPSGTSEGILTWSNGSRNQETTVKLTAPISSEWGERARFLEIASGRLASTSYTTVNAQPDGGSTISVTITRKDATTLWEDGGTSRSELSLDEHGHVVRQVGGGRVIERVVAYRP